jgi:hypothetical protein
MEEESLDLKLCINGFIQTTPEIQQWTPIVPTYEGYVSTTDDALILFEAVLKGVLTTILRRPREHELEEIIKSGNTFVYEEGEAGIMHWFDHLAWSPHSKVGDFTFYSQVKEPLGRGGRKRFKKDMPFVEHGLVKKVISVKWKDCRYHLISYHTTKDVTELETPSARLGHIEPRQELISQVSHSNFSGHQTPLEPTYKGYVSTTDDALILFEAVLKGVLAAIPRRPGKREWEELIKSGHIVVYEEEKAGIKRWNDHLAWSVSSPVGDFTLYRQVKEPLGCHRRKLLKKDK